MSSEMKHIVIINGSPKPVAEVSVSGMLASLAEERLKSESMRISHISVRKSVNKRDEQEYLEIINADALLFVFPLYYYCLPGILIRYLQDFYEYFLQHKSESKSGINVYAIVNCGFPESNINEEALRVIKSFCAHINASYRFGISIGAGGMFLGAKDAPFMKKPMEKLGGAYSRIADDIAHTAQPGEDVIYIELKLPRALYFLGGNMGWNQMARKNGLKKKDLYRRPY